MQFPISLYDFLPKVQIFSSQNIFRQRGQKRDQLSHLYNTSEIKILIWYFNAQLCVCVCGVGCHEIKPTYKQIIRLTFCGLENRDLYVARSLRNFMFKHHG
jgi:hypothetical protein